MRLHHLVLCFAGLSCFTEGLLATPLKALSVFKTLDTEDAVSELSSRTSPSVALIQGTFSSRSNLSAWKEPCDKHIKRHPDDIHCPSLCPYIRQEPTRLCEFKCVPATSCSSDVPMASYANPQTMWCETCKVSGCHRCGLSRDECAECQEGFALQSDGKCMTIYKPVWNAVFTLLGCVGLFVVAYLVILYNRPIVNETALKEGLKFRKLSMVRNLVLGRPYSLWTDLRTRLVAGPGVNLHFRWIFMVTMWSFVGMFIFFIAMIVFRVSNRWFAPENPQKTSPMVNACSSSSATDKAEKDFNEMEAVYSGCVLLLYLITFVGSLIFAYHQKRFYKKVDDANVTMKDFALYAQGFPEITGTDHAEEEQKRFFQDHPDLKDLKVVGVSVAWDYRKCQDEVDSQITREFDIHGRLHDDNYAGQHKEAMSARDNDKATKQCFDPQLKFVDKVLGVGGETAADDEQDPEAVRKLISELKTSPWSIVVFGTTDDRDTAYARCKDGQVKLMFRGENEIFLTEKFSEPNTVLWNGFGAKTWEFIGSLLMGCVILAIAIVLLDIFFYAPYVGYIISYKDVIMSDANFGNQLSGILLGMLIVVCNNIIYFTISSVAEHCPWASMDTRACFYTVQYALAVWFNTMLDLGTVIVLAEGYSLDQVAQKEMAEDSSLSAKGISESPNMQAALYEQMIMYLMPSCFVIPFLLEPVICMALHYVNQLLVRSRTCVGPQDAELLLKGNPYDLSRYGDIFVNMMLCCVCMAFTNPRQWRIFVFFAISMGIIWAWDQVRLLRFSEALTIASNVIDVTMSYMLALPCGLLLSICAYKAWGASHAGELKDTYKKMKAFDTDALDVDRFKIFLVMGGVFATHLLLHWLLLTFVVHPLAEKKGKDDNAGPDNTRYEDVAKDYPENWFTTNPIHCLRSKYIYQDSPPCTYYRIGKEHLVKKNEKIGIYWNPEAHKPELTPRVEEEEEAAIENPTSPQGRATAAARNLRQTVAQFSAGV